VPVRFATNFYEEKWRDFFESIRLSPVIETLPVMYEYRQPLWRLLRNSIKKTLSKMVLTSPKWSRLPASTRLATDSQLAHLAFELKKIAHDTEGVLSEDAVVDDVTCRLMAKLEELKQEFVSGALFSYDQPLNDHHRISGINKRL
jgi:hypothetical protein